MELKDLQNNLPTCCSAGSDISSYPSPFVSIPPIEGLPSITIDANSPSPSSIQNGVKCWCVEFLNWSKKRVTFICRQACVYALGAVLAKHIGDKQPSDHYIKLPNKLLYGRSGYLWACSFLNKNIVNDTIPLTQTVTLSSFRERPVVDEIIKSNRKLSNKGNCPLMYELHGKNYWGAADGLAGIMHVLMDMDLKPYEVVDVKNTLRYMIKHRFTNGYYTSSKENVLDRLCIGAMVLLGSHLPL